MLSTPSLCPLFPSTIHACRLNGERADARPERRHGDDDNRRRVHGNADMPLNRSRLTLSPDHIASAMRDMTFSNDPAVSDLAASLAALHQTRQAAQQTPSTSRSPSPEDPRDISAPLHIFQRRSTAPELSSNTDDTRRHGVVIQDALPLHPPPSPSPPPHDNPDDDLTSSASSISSEPLPSYTPLPPRPTRRMTSLRRQWVQHTRRSSSAPLTARTHYRAPIAQSHDLPPPYAPTDPYPLYASLPSPHCPPEPSSNSNKPSLWARAVLYPFVPEGVLLDKAAGATERACAKVKFRVKKGVEAVGEGARRVERGIEKTRAERKIRWLEGRGLVEVAGREERRCPSYAGAWHGDGGL